MKKNELKALLLALGISTSSMMLTGCNEKEDYILFNTVLDDVSDSTCIDEILSLEENKDVLTDFYILDNYLFLSEKLHSLELEQVVEKEELSSDEDILPLKEIEPLIYKLECESPKDDQYKSDAKLLIATEGHINKYLYEYGDSTIEKLASLISKGKIVNALGLPKEEYKNIGIFVNPEDYGVFFDENVQIEYLNKKGNKIYYQLSITNDFFGEESMLCKCINMNYESRKQQTQAPSKNKYGFVAYDGDRNQSLDEKIQILKQVPYASYEVDGNCIRQKTTNDKVKEIYKEKVKKLK